MVGQQLYSRANFAYGSEKINPGFCTFAFTENMLNDLTDRNERNAVREILEARCSLPEDLNVSSKVISYHQSLLRIYHPFKGTTAICRTYMVIDQITKNGRQVPYTHSYILTEEENDKFLQEPSPAFDLERFERYEDIVLRIQSDGRVGLEEDLSDKFLEMDSFSLTESQWDDSKGSNIHELRFKCKEILKEVGFDLDTFARFFATLIREVGNDGVKGEEGKIALILPDNMYWNSSDSIGSAEKVIYTLMYLLPLRLRRKFGAVSYWDGQAESKHIKGMQLILSDAVYAPELQKKIPLAYIGLKGNAAFGMDEKTEYAKFVWENLSNQTLIEEFEEYLGNLLGEKGRSQVMTLSRIESCYLIWIAEKNGFTSVEECKHGIIAVANTFSGYVEKFPNLITFTEKCLNTLKNPENTLADTMADEAVSRLLLKEKGYHKYFNNAIKFLMIRIYQSQSSENARKALLKLFMERQDAPLDAMVSILSLWETNIERFNIAEFSDPLALIRDLAMAAFDEPSSTIFMKAKDILHKLTKRIIAENKWEVFIDNLPFYEELLKRSPLENDETEKVYKDLIISCICAGSEYAPIIVDTINELTWEHFHDEKNRVNILKRIFKELLENNEIKSKHCNHDYVPIIYRIIASKGSEGYDEDLYEIYYNVLNQIKAADHDGSSIQTFLKHQLHVFKEITKQNNECLLLDAVMGYSKYIESVNVNDGFYPDKKRLGMILDWYKKAYEDKKCIKEIANFLYEYGKHYVRGNELYESYYELLEENQLNIFLYFVSIALKANYKEFKGGNIIERELEGRLSESIVNKDLNDIARIREQMRDATFNLQSIINKNGKHEYIEEKLPLEQYASNYYKYLHFDLEERGYLSKEAIEDDEKREYLMNEYDLFHETFPDTMSFWDFHKLLSDLIIKLCTDFESITSVSDKVLEDCLKIFLIKTEGDQHVEIKNQIEFIISLSEMVREIKNNEGLSKDASYYEGKFNEFPKLSIYLELGCEKLEREINNFIKDNIEQRPKKLKLAIFLCILEGMKNVPQEQTQDDNLLLKKRFRISRMLELMGTEYSSKTSILDCLDAYESTMDSLPDKSIYVFPELKEYIDNMIDIKLNFFNEMDVAKKFLKCYNNARNKLDVQTLQKENYWKTATADFINLVRKICQALKDTAADQMALQLYRKILSGNNHNSQMESKKKSITEDNAEAKSKDIKFLIGFASISISGFVVAILGLLFDRMKNMEAGYIHIINLLIGVTAIMVAMLVWLYGFLSDKKDVNH